MMKDLIVITVIILTVIIVPALLIRHFKEKNIQNTAKEFQLKKHIKPGMPSRWSLPNYDISWIYKVNGKTRPLMRIVDHEYGIVCYYNDDPAIFDSPAISCVKIEKGKKE